MVQREVVCAPHSRAGLALDIGQRNLKICFCVNGPPGPLQGQRFPAMPPCYPSTTLCLFWPALSHTPFQAHFRILPSLGTPVETVQSQLCARHKEFLSQQVLFTGMEANSCPMALFNQPSWQGTTEQSPSLDGFTK